MKVREYLLADGYRCGLFYGKRYKKATRENREAIKETLAEMHRPVQKVFQQHEESALRKPELSKFR